MVRISPAPRWEIAADSRELRLADDAADGKAGGPFDKEGKIGQQFTDRGAIGGTVDRALGERK